MRQHRARGSTFEARVEAEIDVIDDSWDALVARGKPRQDGVAAFAAVGDEGLDEWLRIGDRGTVRRPVKVVVARQELGERAHIGRHVAIGRRDNAGRPPHDMIAGKERAILGEREAEMVRGVAGRVDGGEPPSRSLHNIALTHLHVGTKIVIATFLRDAADAGAILGAA